MGKDELMAKYVNVIIFAATVLMVMETQASTIFKCDIVGMNKKDLKTGQMEISSTGSYFDGSLDMLELIVEQGGEKLVYVHGGKYEFQLVKVSSGNNHEVFRYVKDHDKRLLIEVTFYRKKEVYIIVITEDVRIYTDLMCSRSYIGK
jgi:hypothetical protein